MFFAGMFIIANAVSDGIIAEVIGGLIVAGVVYLVTYAATRWLK